MSKKIISKIAAFLTVTLAFSFAGVNTAFANNLNLGPDDRIPGTNSTVWGPNSTAVVNGAGQSGLGATVFNSNDFNIVLDFVLDGTLPSNFVIDLSSGGWDSQNIGSTIIDFTGNSDVVTIWGNNHDLFETNFIVKNGTLELVSVNLIGNGISSAIIVNSGAALNFRTGSSIQNYGIGIFSQGNVTIQNLRSVPVITNSTIASVVNEGGVFTIQAPMVITGDLTQ